MPNPPARWRADLALAGVALIWGTTFVVVKSAITEISTTYFLALRFWIATLCMIALFAAPFRQAGKRAVWKGLLGGAAAGFFLWAGYMFQTYGLARTTAGKSGFITGLYIVLVPILSACFYRRWPRPLELVGVAITTVGMALMMMPSMTLDINRGDLLTVACAVAFAFQLLVLGYYSQRERYEAVAFGQILAAALLCTAGLLVEPPHAIWSANVIFALVLTGVFATAGAFALQTWAQQYTTATRTALIFALEPVFALVTAIGLAGESLSPKGIGGAVLILSGIVLVELKPATRS
jgi:drug/metabolite transporter (DMT)-like permease